MQNKNQMKSFQTGTSRIGQGLYPIIRRVRRPLLPVDDIPTVQQSDAKPDSGLAKSATPEKQQGEATQKQSDDQAASSEKDY